MDEPFVAYHPAVNFTFFATAVLFAMLFMQPCFLGISAGMALLYYLLLNKNRSKKFLFSTAFLTVLITLLNPLFNTNGSTVLFTLWGGRPYTQEALLYGFATGATFFSVILWFACYNCVITSDKFIYLFGRFTPAVSLMITMVFRLVPSYKRSAQAISNARKCIGKSTAGGKTFLKLKNSMLELSALTSSALENSIIAADSMKSRGYGCAKRTAFPRYRWRMADRVFLLVLLAAGLFVIVCGSRSSVPLWGGLSNSFAVPDKYLAVGAAGYAVLLFLPSFIHIKEELQWKYFISKI